LVDAHAFAWKVTLDFLPPYVRLVRMSCTWFDANASIRIFLFIIDSKASDFIFVSIVQIVDRHMLLV